MYNGTYIIGIVIISLFMLFQSILFYAINQKKVLNDAEIRYTAKSFTCYDIQTETIDHYNGQTAQKEYCYLRENTDSEVNAEEISVEGEYEIGETYTIEYADVYFPYNGSSYREYKAEDVSVKEFKDTVDRNMESYSKRLLASMGNTLILIFVAEELIIIFTMHNIWENIKTSPNA
jgi:hypothetical protein